MITYTEYEDYFEGLATKFKPIGHTPQAPKFATMDIDDIIGNARGDLDFDTPCLILENFEGELEYKHDRMLDETYGAFLIIMRVERNNPVQKREVMNLTKILGLKVISKIQKQKESLFRGQTGTPKMVMYFQMNNVKYNKVSNVFNECHGWRFEFNLGREDAIPHSEADWEE